MDTPNNTSPSLSNEAAEEIREQLRLWAQSHQYLLQIFLDAFAIVDVTGRVVDFNVAFTELCGESYRKVLKIGELKQLIQIEQEPLQQVITQRKPIRLDELKGSSKAYPSLSLILGAVPIFAADETILGALMTIRNVSAESELQKKYDERKEESVMDGLTRLFNKVYTENQLARMVKNALREPQVVSVIMCDIDHFKKVNDTYGHQAGDHVLASVAQMLKGESRETDVVGRFGGEEFTAILYNSDQAGTKIFGERFRKRVESTQILYEGKHIPVTVSLGSATFLQKWAPGVESEGLSKELIARADAALYFAKANGRNQICQAENLAADKIEMARIAKAASVKTR